MFIYEHYGHCGFCGAYLGLANFLNVFSKREEKLECLIRENVLSALFIQFISNVNTSCSIRIVFIDVSKKPNIRVIKNLLFILFRNLDGFGIGFGNFLIFNYKTIALEAIFSLSFDVLITR